MISIQQLHPDSAPAREVMRAYLEDVAGSYQGRRLTASELEAVVAEFPNHDLAAPHGGLLVALSGDVPVGCVGLRIVPEHIGEVTRLYVAPPFRRAGLGTRLVAGVERLARERGIGSLRLDTRHDLTEARALYAACGFREVEPFNSGAYAEHWFEKALG